jgi:GT2 family glycosyltransferase
VQFDNPPKITVIIPTRNRRDSLGRLLTCLKESQSIDEFCEAVVVINNASTDDSQQFLELLAQEWPLLKVLNEKRPGKNYALNRGLREAAGEIICLMDDDIILDRGWVIALERDFRETGYDALQPRVLPGLDPEGREANYDQLYQYNIPVIDYGNGLCEVRGLTGVIMSFRIQVYQKIGGFDERLPASGYHGDTDFSKRIRNAGYKIGYTPHVLAFHELNPERYGSPYARISQYRKGLSRSLYGNASLIGDIFPNLMANIFRYSLYRLRRKQDKVYKTEKRIMKYWGYLAGRVQRKLGKNPWV